MDMTCAKRRYRDRVAALMALVSIDKADKHGHDEQRAYKCPHCKGWHLTSEDKR